MTVTKKHPGNPLGALAAEHDHLMLEAAFFATPDYLSLIESDDKAVVVGRRGSGKSALAYKLAKHWHKVPKIRVIEIALDKAQVIGLAPVFTKFGDKYRLICAGCEKAWHYCLLMEVASNLSSYFKFEKSDKTGILSRNLAVWRRFGDEVTGRLRRFFESILKPDSSPEQQIADLAEKLELGALDRALREAIELLGFRCIVLVDRLDEGYEPTDIGIGFVDGIVNATIELNARCSQIQSILFLRDNMFRSVAKRNLDFSRNIEGEVLRLHWDDYQLMNMVCNRLKVAFGITEEQTTAVWNQCVSNELKGRGGFRKCLQFTLYRPRDILVLLNAAFYEASKANQREIIPDNMRAAGKTISDHRLDDLRKEYEAIIPGIEYLTGAFGSRKPELTVAEAKSILSPVLASSAHTTQVQLSFAILDDSMEVLRSLYGVGFVGMRDPESGSFVFCHDGKSPDREIKPTDTLLIHPCYWMALNLQEVLSPGDAEEIHDEYDIEVSEDGSAQRERKLNEAISQFGKIPLGDEGQDDFEQWCQKAISTVFAGALRNVASVARAHSTNRHYVVALNLGKTEAWRRVLEDYGARQVVFVPENQQDLPLDAYKRAPANLDDANGNLVFLVTRDGSMEVSKEKDLGWVRDIYDVSGNLVVRLTGKFLCKLLGKLRNPQKHDVVEKTVNGTLDMYSRNHLKGLSSKRVTAQAKASATVAADEQTVSIAVPPAECYGEIGVDATTGETWLGVFKSRRGPGNRPELCTKIVLQDQAYRILEGGIEHGRLRYTSDKLVQARASGNPDGIADCEPSPEQTFVVEWGKDDLAVVLQDKKRFAECSKPQKNAIKTAMSRLRSLVVFGPDQVGLVSEAEADGTRRAAIPLRFTSKTRA